MTTFAARPASKAKPSRRYFGPRGYYGEMIVPSLVRDIEGDAADDQVIEFIVRYNAARNNRVDEPEKGQARQGLANIARSLIHNLRLRELFAEGESEQPGDSKVMRALFGRLTVTQELDALRKAVIEEGDAINLSPLGLDSLRSTAYAPVLRRLKDTLWMFGAEGAGYLEKFEAASPLEALEKAQAVYVAQSEADYEKFRGQVGNVVAPHSLLHDYALWRLTLGNRQWRQSEGWAVTAIGAHDMMRYDSPDESRVIQVAPSKLIKFLDATARTRRAEPDFPTLPRLQAWLDGIGAPTAKAAVWNSKDALGLPAEVEGRSGRYSLSFQRGFLKVSRVLKDGGQRVVIETVLEKQLVMWLKGGEERDVVRAMLSAWALWAAGEAG